MKYPQVFERTTTSLPGTDLTAGDMGVKVNAVMPPGVDITGYAY